MTFKNQMLTIGSILAIILLTLAPTTIAVETSFQNSLDTFSRNIFSEFYQTNGQKSLILSPFSIQTCLAMVRMGAGGSTAEEMDRGLILTGQNPQTVADNYHSMLAKYENSKILKIANKIYATKDHELNDEYRKILTEKFYSEAENIDFAEAEKAAENINAWVASKTDNLIKDLVAADNFNSDTVLFLLSAIHFDGKWASAFPKENTQEMDFKTDNCTIVPVQMMELRSSFEFGLAKELDAQIARLPYKDSDLSMLLVLPNEVNGLAKMEEKLKKFDFQTMMKKSLEESAKLEVRLPKFKAEFKIELNDILKKVGMKQMFDQADFGKMLKTPKPLAISTVLHKAFIEVNEEGTKAAAVTGASASLRIANPYSRFYLDRPFYYAIVNEDFVPFFQGTFIGF